MGTLNEKYKNNKLLVQEQETVLLVHDQKLSIFLHFHHHRSRLCSLHSQMQLHLFLTGDRRQVEY